MFRKRVPVIVPLHEIASVCDDHDLSPRARARAAAAAAAAAPPAARPLRKNKRLRAAAQLCTLPEPRRKQLRATPPSPPSPPPSPPLPPPPPQLPPLPPPPPPPQVAPPPPAAAVLSAPPPAGAALPALPAPPVLRAPAPPAQPAQPKPRRAPSKKSRRAAAAAGNEVVAPAAAPSSVSSPSPSPAPPPLSAAAAAVAAAAAAQRPPPPSSSAGSQASLSAALPPISLPSLPLLAAPPPPPPPPSNAPPVRTPTRAAARAASRAVAATAAAERTRVSTRVKDKPREALQTGTVANAPVTQPSPAPPTANVAHSAPQPPHKRKPPLYDKSPEHPVQRDVDKLLAPPKSKPKPRDNDREHAVKAEPARKPMSSSSSQSPRLSFDSLDSELMGANNDLSTQALLKIAPAASSHGIVWTKIKGHPFWPAQKVPMSPQLEEQDRFQSAAKFRRRVDDTCVMYFGTCEVAFVNVGKSCITWQEGIERNMHMSLKGRAVFQRALSEVKAFCHRVQRFPRGWWCEPEVMALYHEFYDQCLLSELHIRLREYIQRAESELIFWAKGRRHPHWPVQVLPRNMAAERYPQLKLTPDSSSMSSSMPCMFFGTGEVAMINERNFTPFGAGLARGYVTSNDRQDFTVALGELWGYLQETRVWPSGYLSKRSWWNYEDMIAAPSPNSSSEFHVPHLPHYEHIKKSVWCEGIELPQKPRRSDVSCCDCEPSAEATCVDASCLNFASRFLCNPMACGGGPKCGNSSFHRRTLPKLRPFFTADQRGWGLRAEEPIKRGSFVVEYVGEIIDRDMLENRLKEAQKRKSHEYYIMDLTNDLFVDAKFKGNLSRFINSSCDPNCATQKWTDSVSGQTHVGIFAKQDIPAGTELTYNYCFEDFGLLGKSQKRSFMCQCGTSSCCMLDPEEKKQMKLLIGKRLEVRWDDGWYPGIVESYSLKKKKFRVQYDDGDCEDLTLGLKTAVDDNVRFRLMEPPSDGESSKSSKGSKKSKEAE